ncbi:hypothetical protein ACFQ0O_25025 [Saccharopolyspora spinosporotrichia]
MDGGELGDDPAATYRDSADLAVAAYLVEDIAGRRMVLEELPGPLPALVAISFHFTDSLVHGWDVARSIGVPFQPPDELSGAALGIGSRIPDGARGPGERSARPSSPFPAPAISIDCCVWSAATRTGLPRSHEVAGRSASAPQNAGFPLTEPGVFTPERALVLVNIRRVFNDLLSRRFASNHVSLFATELDRSKPMTGSCWWVCVSSHVRYI